MSNRLNYEKLESKTGKDMGDFGGWHGLKEYCIDWYGDDAEVMDLVATIDKERLND
jgi:hypothetical protein